MVLHMERTNAFACNKYRVYTFREEYRLCGMAAIYSELLEDYFLTNINGDLFGDDDGTKDNTEEDTASIGTE